MQANSNLQSSSRETSASTVLSRVRAALVFAWEVYVEAQGARAQAFSRFKYPG